MVDLEELELEEVDLTLDEVDITLESEAPDADAGDRVKRGGKSSSLMEDAEYDEYLNDIFEEAINTINVKGTLDVDTFKKIVKDKQSGHTKAVYAGQGAKLNLADHAKNVAKELKDHPKQAAIAGAAGLAAGAAAGYAAKKIADKVDKKEENKDKEVKEDVEFNLEDANFIEQYAKNIFMESILDPAAKEVNDKIIDLKGDKTCSIEDMITVLESINNSTLHRNSKDKLVANLIEAYTASRDNEVLEENNNYLIEYSGNPEKNAEFIKYLNLMEKYAQDYIDYNGKLFKLGNDIIDTLSKCIDNKKKAPTGEDLRAAVNTCMNHIDDFNKMAVKEYRQLFIEDGKNFKKYEALRKKFNNKYSTETLEAKKEIDKKLDALFTSIIEGEMLEWMQIDDVRNCKKYDEIVRLWEAAKVIDRDYAQRLLERVLNPYLETLYNSVIYVANFIRYIRYHLDIEIEYRTSFKLVQRFLKDKKDGGYSEETKSQIIKLK